jgi:hypothetical protein
VDVGGREVSRSRLQDSGWRGVAYLAFMAITIPWQGCRDGEILINLMCGVSTRHEEKINASKSEHGTLPAIKFKRVVRSLLEIPGCDIFELSYTIIQTPCSDIRRSSNLFSALLVPEILVAFLLHYPLSSFSLQ